MAPRQARALFCRLASPHLTCAGKGGPVLGREQRQPRPVTRSNERGLDPQAALPTHPCARVGGSMLGVPKHSTA